MRIITPPTVGAVAQGPATQRADRPRSAFELPGGKAETPSTAAARPTVAAAGLETLLAVQGMQPEDRREKRRRAMQRGRADSRKSQENMPCRNSSAAATP